MAIIFTEPEMLHATAIQDFKEAFGDSPLHGTEGLRRCTNVTDWLIKREWRARGDYLYILYDTCANVVLGCCRLSPVISAKLVRLSGYNFGYSVHPSYRRKGYGRRLILECAAAAKAHGLDEMLMSADADNVSSWKCMESVGAELIFKVANDEGTHYVYSVPTTAEE